MVHNITGQLGLYIGYRLITRTGHFLCLRFVLARLSLDAPVPSQLPPAIASRVADAPTLRRTGRALSAEVRPAPAFVQRCGGIKVSGEENTDKPFLASLQSRKA